MRDSISAPESTSEGTERCFLDRLRRGAEDDPSHAAILAPGRTPLTYAALVGIIDDVARSLNAAGCGVGDRVAVVLPNGPEMATAFLGVSAAACCAPLNPGYRSAEFDEALADLEARAILV